MGGGQKKARVPTSPHKMTKKKEIESARWALALKEAKETGTCSDPDIARKCGKQAKWIHMQEKRKRTLDNLPDGEQHLWYWGSDAAGMTEKVMHDYPGAFHKPPNTRWKGYDDEEVVIIDGVTTQHKKLRHEFRMWGERYPFEANGMQVRPKLVVVISDRHPNDIWKNDEHMAGGLSWRYNIVEFKTAVEKVNGSA